ncbi:hypothetical protein Pan216_21430 [Planctomycetes bacterium Pan216]|uniref:PAAR motif protein n=1 Tax=Kolteria novifilia TaxID=2527975 RepID=A0A518B2T3_9BACT|nr:hypothetical protein Pan216_21430 [Planctomycetes bacterium Pan216]
MSSLAVTLGGLDSGANVITGPCAETVLLDGLFASVETDIVSGATLEGVVAEGSVTVLFGGLPATYVGSLVSGVSVETGVAMETAIVGPGVATVIIPM